MVCYTKKAIHPYPEFRTVSLFSSSFPCGSKIYPFIFKICLSSLWLLHNHEMKTLGSQSFYTDWGTESKWFKEFRDGVKPWASSVEVIAWSLWARTPVQGYTASGSTWFPLLGVWCWSSSQHWGTESATSGWSLLASHTPFPGRWRLCSAGQRQQGE